MKHLKLFEAFGIDTNIEHQVDVYFRKIQSEPNQLRFNFLFQNDQVNCYFDLIINPKLNSEGKFIEYKGKLEVHIKNRNDLPTLLHEVKHLDYRIKNKKLSETMYHKAKEILNNYSNTPSYLILMFYVYDENEFQSKYHGYYKEFKEYCKGKIDSESTLDQLKNLWLKYLLSCDDTTWCYYLIDKEFKFSNFISDKKLDNCLYHMLEAGITTKPDIFKWSKNWITNNIKYVWNQVRVKFGIYTKEERAEIDKLRKYFENTFKKRHSKMKRKFARMVILVAQQYNIKY